MKLLKSQKGFTALEVTLVIVTLIAIGVAGYFAFQARQDKIDSSASAPQKTETTTKPATASAPTSQQAVDATKVIYDKVVAGWSDSLMEDVIKNNPTLFTSQFASQAMTRGSKINNDGLPLVCGGNGITVPDSVNYSVNSSNASTASVKVVFVYNGGSPVDWNANLVATDGKWLFNGLTCQ